jgi:PAS domain S-box-containing protein
LFCVPARITAGYLGLLTVFGAGVFLLPGLSAPLWVAIGALSAAAIGYGARRHGPQSRGPWWLLAAAVLAMAAGDVLYAVDAGAGGPASILADAGYLAMFVLVAMGLLRMTRATVVLPDRARMLDLLTFACAAGLATWLTLVGPALAATHLSSAERSVLAAYALGDALLLITVVRLAVAGRRSWTLALLLAGVVGLLVGDAAYAQAQLGDGWRAGQPAELGYLLLYGCWGAAALHPSMTALTDPVDTWPVRLPGRRAALLAGSLAVPPVLLIVQTATGGVRDGLVIGASSLIMLFLVVIRLGDAIGRYRCSLIRERALRKACGALVGATDATQVSAATRAAVAELLPGQGYEVVVVEAEEGWLPAVSADRRTRLIDLTLLDPAVRDRLAGPGGAEPGAHAAPDAALVCPLDVEGHPGGVDTLAAALVVAGGRSALTTTRNAIEVLAAQAALAMERIWLTEAMARSDTDRYLRAVVQNASDVVLIVEPSGEIRYASPSLATVVELDPSGPPALRDLVDGADHDRMEDTLRRADTDGVRAEWTLRGVDGGRATVEVSCRDLRGDRMVRGYVITLRDVTERWRAEREIIRQALDATPAGQNRHSSSTKFRLPS